MRIQHCCIDAPVVEARCDQQLRRYLILRDATLHLGLGTRDIVVNVVVTGIDCDHFGPLLRSGRVVEAEVEIADGCYRLIDVARARHADQRDRTREQGLREERVRQDEIREQAAAVLRRAQRA